MRKGLYSHICPICRSSLGSDVIANSKESAELLNESPAALLDQAHIAHAAKDFVKVAYDFGAELEQEPANKKALFGKANAHRHYVDLLKAQGKLEEAVDHYEEAAEHYEVALKIDPNDADTYYNYGILLKAQGRLTPTTPTSTPTTVISSWLRVTS